VVASYQPGDVGRGRLIDPVGDEKKPSPERSPVLDPDGTNSWIPPELKQAGWSELQDPTLVQPHRTRGLGAVPAEDRRSRPKVGDDDSEVQASHAGRRHGEDELDNDLSSSEKEPKHWVAIPTPPETTSEVIWHYTDAPGALGVIGSGTLWATSIAFLNDRQEYDYGLAFMREVDELVQASRYVHPLQKLYLKSCLIAATAPNVALRTFVTCASEAGDSLAQWRAYGSSAGYSLGLDPRAPALLLCEGADDEGFAYSTVVSDWHRVVYEPDEQRKLATETIALVLLGAPHPSEPTGVPYADAVDMSAAHIVATAAYIKHPSFVEEQEVRAVLSVVEGVDDTAIKRRPTPYGIAPYVQLTFDPVSSGGSKRARRSDTGPLPLCAARVGPGPSQATASAGLADLLLQTHPDVAVALSDAPLR